jgi:hypothetical protein
MHKWLHYGKLCVRISIKLYKGLMLRVDDQQKEIQALKIGACKIHLHGTFVEPFLDLISKAYVWVNARSLSGVSLGWAERR